MHPKESGFEYENSNPLIYLWNTQNNTIFPFKTDLLDPIIIDFLSAANTNFTQDDQFLYTLGGYGQSKNGKFKTHPVFLRVDLKKCIDSILGNGDISSAFKYIVSDHFAVAGAQLRIMDSLFYLVGGHLFSDKYDHNNHSLNQKYTDALSIFKIVEQGDTLHYIPIQTIIDDFNFHRRDYNLNPVITETGELNLMVYSGVFQYNINRPFLNTSLIKKRSFVELPDFEHKFASYNCARFACFDSTNNEFHQLFFGGMAEYYRDSIMNLTKDTYVPFVKSISSVTRRSDGSFFEYLYEEELPGFFGTNSEFLLNPDLKVLYEDIVDITSLNKDTTYLGLLFGGIYNPSKMRNPWQNDSAHLTMSNPYHLKIFFIPDKIMSVENSKYIPEESIDIKLIPNPANTQIKIEFPRDLKIKRLKISMLDSSGQTLKEYNYKDLASHELLLNTSELLPQQYTLMFQINDHIKLRKKVSILK